MNLRLLASTPAVETIIATAMLTTTSGVTPSTLFHMLSNNPEKVTKVVERLKVQHGSTLEHNKLNWFLEANEGEVLKILLTNRFFTFTRLGSNRWLVSGNLRTVLESQILGGDFASLLVESISLVAPSIYALARRMR